MFQPTTQFTVLLLLVVSAFCWGSWANAFKAAKKWRFEYFYYDFTLGILLTTVIGAFTLGTMNSQDLSFQDNFLLAAYRKMAWALGAGIVFNLGNILLLAGTAICGMSVAFPVALGVGLAVGAILEFAFNPQGSLLLVSGGVLIVIIGVVATIMAYSGRQQERAQAAQKPLTPDPRARNARRPSPSWKGVVLAVVSGLILSAFLPMVANATVGETGVSPYGTALLLSAGIVTSSMLFVPFFLFFPVLGQAGQIRDYFSGTAKQHALGILGGIVWGVGALTLLLAAAAPPIMQPSRATRYALDHTALLIAAVWGIVVWQEFRGASYRVRMMLVAMFVLFLAGTGLVAMAPIYGK